MKFIGSDAAFRHLREWITHDPWERRWEDYQQAHFPDALMARMVKLPGAREIDADVWGQWEGFALEDLMSARFGPSGENLVDDYLARRGWREAAQAKQYFRAIRDSRASLYEVADREPGRSMTLSDLVGGLPPVTVLEKLGSMSSAQWDRLVGRVLSVGGKHYMTGAVMRLEFEAADRLLARLRRDQDIAFAPGRGPPLFTQAWLEYWIDRFEKPTRFVNFQGHDLAFVEVRFPIRDGTASAVAARLDAAAELVRDSPGEARWSWHVDPPSREPKPQATSPERALTVGRVDEEGRRVAGTVSLSGQTLLLEANSAERGQAGTAWLHALLGDLAGAPVTTTKTPAELLATTPREPRPPDRASAIPPQERRRIAHEYMDQHYRRTLDEKLPALEGRTPRQCARAKRHRHLVIAWLKLVENGHARGSGGDADGYDPSWLWAELGLERERAAPSGS